MKHSSWYSALLFIFLIIGWHMASLSFSELVLPSPKSVFAALWDGLVSGYLLPHLYRTFFEVMLGLLIGSVLGLFMGILMGEVNGIRRLLLPYIIASQAVPKLALAPLFILWFGFGMTSKVVITALICFFPLLENTITAMQRTDPNKKELFRVLQATRWQTLIHLKLPDGLPEIMAGLRVAVILAVVGAVVGEFIGGSEGLGAMIIASQGMMDTPLMFAVLILLTALGMALYGIICMAENLYLSRYEKGKKR